MASKKLTSDEVNALMEGLQNSDYTVSVDLAKSDDVRPFAFGEDDLSLMGDYYALRQVNERFAVRHGLFFCRCCVCSPALHRFLLRLKPLMNIVIALIIL